MAKIVLSGILQHRQHNHCTHQVDYQGVSSLKASTDTATQPILQSNTCACYCRGSSYHSNLGGDLVQESSAFLEKPLKEVY